MNIWHYLDKHNQTKQIAEDELLPLANAGEITPQTNIWKEGMANWAPAGTVLPQLFADVPSSPPAIPTGTAMGSDPGQRCHEVDYELFGDDMQIVQIELDPGETVIAEAGAMNYMEEDITFEAKMGDGMCFIHAGGTLIKRELKGETLRVDTGCLVAFTDGVTYDIQRAGNLKSMFFGGEGLFLATLHGQGTVWLQSLPFSRLADRVMANVGSRGKGEGSILGGLGNLLDGD